MYMAIDTETKLIKPGNLAPDLICMSYYDGETIGLVDRHGAPEFLSSLALRDDLSLIGHNIAYDVAVLCAHSPDLLPLFVRLYDEKRVWDTKILETLFYIRTGTLKLNLSKLSLGALAEKYLGKPLDKGEDSWRLHYAELEDVSLDVWPERARAYAEEDARSTYEVFHKMDTSKAPDQHLQVCAALGLHAMACWGIRTDLEAVDTLEEGLLVECIDLRKSLHECGFIRENGSKNTKAIKERVENFFDGRPPKTAKGSIKIDDQTLALIDDPEIERLRALQKKDKLLTSFIPVLRQGTSAPITPRFNVLVESGRTSCSQPNIQQLPRSGGARECFIPRDGFLFASCDYDAVEMRALAQICFSWFGESNMRTAFLEGLDPHVQVAAALLHLDYQTALNQYHAGDQAVANARQLCKIANYGYAGGMGAQSFVDYARGYDVELSPSHAEKIKGAWLKAWPEMHQYFAVIADICGDMGSHEIVQFKSGRVRGNLTFCQAANTFFQGLVADAAKHTVWEVFKASYVDSKSALFGSRPIVFAHDEIVVEVPKYQASDAADELAHVMIETAQSWMPDVPITAEPVLMPRWYKGAKTVRNEQGELIPWEPKAA